MVWLEDPYGFQELTPLLGTLFLKWERQIKVIYSNFKGFSLKAL